MKDKPNKVTTVLKVIVTGEFYDDDSTEETLRYAVEQDLEDAGFDVNVALLKEQKAVKPFSDDDGGYWCSSCHEDIVWHQKFCSNCGRPVLWEGW